MPDTLKKSRLPAFLKAGDERIELPPKVLETPIIPFDQSPLRLLYELYIQKKQLSIDEYNLLQNLSIIDRGKLIRINQDWPIIQKTHIRQILILYRFSSFWLLCYKILQPYSFFYKNKSYQWFNNICRLNQSKNSYHWQICISA